MKAKAPDKAKAADEVDNAIIAFDDEVDWRSEAASQDLVSKIESYDNAIKGTIGLRQQADMPRELGLYVAGCNAGHRDISLSF